MKAFQAPHITRADVPLADVEAEAARQQFAARMAPLADLLAHPEVAPHTPATVGELAEYRHLLYDADADAATTPFVYCWKGVKP